MPGPATCELANVVRRIVVLDDGDVVTAEMLPATVAPAASNAATMTPPTPAGAIRPFWEQERDIILTALAGTFDGNTAKTAAALDISPSTIYRKRQAWPGG